MSYGCGSEGCADEQERMEQEIDTLRTRLQESEDSERLALRNNEGLRARVASLEAALRATLPRVGMPIDHDTRVLWREDVLAALAPRSERREGELVARHFLHDGSYIDQYAPAAPKEEAP